MQVYLASGEKLQVDRLSTWPAFPAGASTETNGSSMSAKV